MRNKKIVIIASVIILLISVGGIFAINGFFGGGATIPKDTMTNDLVGYWTFDEGSGQTAFDSSVSKNNGVWSGTS
ncbi:hypothetical protein BWK69_00605, partial [Candidatus Parcubacteria bacterium A4]